MLAHFELVAFLDLAIHLALVRKLNGEVEVTVILLVWAALNRSGHQLRRGDDKVVVEVTHRLPPVSVGRCRTYQHRRYTQAHVSRDVSKGCETHALFCENELYTVDGGCR